LVCDPNKSKGSANPTRHQCTMIISTQTPLKKTLPSQRWISGARENLTQLIMGMARRIPSHFLRPRAPFASNQLDVSHSSICPVLASQSCLWNKNFLSASLAPCWFPVIFYSAQNYPATKSCQQCQPGTLLVPSDFPQCPELSSHEILPESYLHPSTHGTSVCVHRVVPMPGNGTSSCSLPAPLTAEQEGAGFS